MNRQFLLCVIVLLSIAMGRSNTVRADLVYQQTFDQGAGDGVPEVTTGGGVLGVNAPGVILSTAGVVGGSYYSGDTIEQVSGASTSLGSPISNLGTLSQFSITFWLNPTHIAASSSTVDRIFVLGASGTTDVTSTTNSVSMSLINSSSNGALPGQLDVWGKGITATNQTGVSGTQLTANGGWVFVALTYDGTSTNGNNSNAQFEATGNSSNLNGQIYLGTGTSSVTNIGVGITNTANDPAASSMGTVNFGTSGGVLVLGNRVSFNGIRAFNGYLDDFRIYDSLLTTAEVEQVRIDSQVPTGLPELIVDRDSGAITLNYPSDVIAPYTFLGYSLQSASGSLNEAGWKSITDNYDAGSDGPNQIDPDDDWTILPDPIDSHLSLSEYSFEGGNGAMLSPGASVLLSNSLGAWIKSPIEDLTMVLSRADGALISLPVTFVGNGDVPFEMGDIDFDGDIDVDDYEILLQNFNNGLLPGNARETYALGDFDGNGFVDFDDAIEFSWLYDQENGDNAFANLIAAATVPEPSALIVLLMGLAFISCYRRRPAQTCKNLVAASCLATLVAASVANAKITYVDATLGTGVSGNTYRPNGEVIQDSATRSSTDNMWTIRDFANGATIWEAYSSENAGAIATTISNLNPVLNYNVYGYSWSPGTDYGASFSLNPEAVNNNGTPEIASDDFLSNSAFSPTGTSPATLMPTAVVNDFTNPKPLVTEEDRTLYQAFLGAVEPDALHQVVVYADHARPDSAGGSRSWIDGVGYSPVHADITLEISTENGQTRIVNSTAGSLNFRYYEIKSDSGGLDFSGWSSLDSQNVDAVDGADGGTFAGDTVGEGWDVTGGSMGNNFALSEFLLHGFHHLASGESLNLGTVFDVVDGQTDGLTFNLGLMDGSLVSANVLFVANGLPGDFNNDSVVNLADYTVWRDNLGGNESALNGNASGDNIVDAVDYQLWKEHFGASSLTTLSATGVPEPTAVTIAVIIAVAMGTSRLRRSLSLFT